ncbi:hypothetical protein BDN72DRAFT_904493 [Pluteus cervinus]|uniref:Uncharacterized protein n=1 Tax=Pluteus cervinus TaxID=181527 RepID=A0ACD3A5M8_9AGAR|nr:hypothetical protein BDN72DRAFT_904493 [Pluteus cervinus]
MAFRLLDLLLELILKIFVDLGSQTLVQCRAVCAQSLEIITNDTELQYLIEFSQQEWSTPVYLSRLLESMIRPSGRLNALSSFIQTRSSLTDPHWHDLSFKVLQSLD